jgi:hypothetical protein
MKTILPVDFFVMVNGNPMAAKLMQIENRVIHLVFVIRFEDGYEDEFYEYEDSCVRGVDEKQSEVYAQALKDDLWLFNLIDGSTTALKNFSWDIDRVPASCWLFTKLRPGGELYTVYVKGNYMFDIWEKSGGWVVNCKNGLHPIDKSLAEHAVLLIGKLPSPAIANTAAPKEIEFTLEFNLKGKKMNAVGIIVYTEPFAQCHVAVKTLHPDPKLNIYQFLKIDSQEKIFSYQPSPEDKDPIAQAIATALEKKFSSDAVFSTN